MTRIADWREERARTLAQARVVVVKVGSAVLADAHGLNVAVLTDLAAQLAALRALSVPGLAEPRRVVLVSSGAVAAGRAALAAHGQHVDTAGLAARQAAAVIPYDGREAFLIRRIIEVQPAHRVDVPVAPGGAVGDDFHGPVGTRPGRGTRAAHGQQENHRQFLIS